jgi:hypothetical protein
LVAGVVEVRGVAVAHEYDESHDGRGDQPAGCADEELTAFFAGETTLGDFARTVDREPEEEEGGEERGEPEHGAEGGTHESAQEERGRGGEEVDSAGRPRSAEVDLGGLEVSADARMSVSAAFPPPPPV